jgi:hypothetical protein
MVLDVETVFFFGSLWIRESQGTPHTLWMHSDVMIVDLRNGILCSTKVSLSVLCLQQSCRNMAANLN